MPIFEPWTPARIRAKILESDVMLERSIVKIYEKQTTSEQNARVTVENNKVGFTAFDAEFLSSLAQQIRNRTQLGSYRREGNRLSMDQRMVARRKMVKYAKQLSKIVDDETPMRAHSSIDVTQTRTTCEDCNGTGGDPSLPPCGRCEGRGYTL